MNMLQLFKSNGAKELINAGGPHSAATEQTEGILMDLAKWGRPSLMQHRDGLWSCGVEVNVTPVGAKFDVRSDFNHASPREAAVVCRDRLHKALDAFGGKT